MKKEKDYRTFVRPNWQDESCYLYTVKLNNTGWAWEFLRRNTAYCSEWDNLVKLEEGKIGWWIPNEGHSEAEKWGLSSGYISPAATGFQVMELNKDQLFFDLSPGIVSGNVGNIERYSSEPKERKIMMRDGQLAFAFDLCLNINDQIDYAKRILKDAQKAIHHFGPRPISIKKHKQNWPDYLRILDGIHCGCSFSAIGEIVYPGNDDPGDRAKKAHKTARSLAEKDYRVIMLIRTPQKTEK
ncbi:transcriptional regulator domain-containing protein [Solidesulfovibrio sp. C21]|uniref:transcriptional regulator domain-containing protein n=1 Tax=Solidesulfovibrio sp. C21 TaxID=3398613 RepID=UPI0039FC2ED4